MARLNGIWKEAAAGATTACIALPLCVSAGVLAYSPLGPERAGEGAVAGIISAVVGSISIWVAAPGGRQRLASIGAGCTVGEMGLLNDLPRSAEVRADDELTSAAFGEILESRPDIGHAVLRGIAR